MKKYSRIVERDRTHSFLNVKTTMVKSQKTIDSVFSKHLSFIQPLRLSCNDRNWEGGGGPGLAKAFTIGPTTQRGKHHTFTVDKEAHQHEKRKRPKSQNCSTAANKGRKLQAIQQRSEVPKSAAAGGGKVIRQHPMLLSTHSKSFNKLR